jgi:hypothetical protein
MWQCLKEKFELLLMALVIMDPTSGWGLVLRNCTRLDGRLSRPRAKAELRLFLRFLAILLVAPLTYLAIIWAALIIFSGHHPFASEDPVRIEAFKIKDDRWWEKVDWSVVQQEFDKIHDYEDWEKNHPVSPDTAKVREKRDEYNRPVLWVGVALFLGIGLLIFVTLLCLAVLKRYHATLLRRKEIYYDIDLQTIPRDRIL